MTDIDFGALRVDLINALAALCTAKNALKDDHSNRSVYAQIDLGAVIQNLSRGMALLDNTEQILKGDN